jgi:hypothetical protein
MAQYKILSLDGGGSWALIQAMALCKIYGPDMRGHKLLSQFDLAAANSGGTLTLGGLLEDMTLADILGLFLSDTNRHEIFVALHWWAHPLLALLRLVGKVGPQYDAAAKLVGLRKIFHTHGDTKLTDLPARIRAAHGKTPRLMISAFDYDRERETFFRSDPQSAAGSFAPPLPPPTLAEAIHASCNAPVNYFDKPAAVARLRYWDGGVGSYNNPILIAVVEAIANGAKPEDIVALSIGTATMFLPMARDYPDEDAALVQPATRQCLKNDIEKLALSILDDPPDDASFIAHVNLGGALPKAADAPVTDTRIVRMNPLIQPVPADDGGWALPGDITEPEFKTLCKLGLDAITPDDVTLIKKFCQAWIDGTAPNQPIRANRRMLAREIGQATFAEAKRQWLSLIQPA